ncbi:MAG TPA: DNA-binding domain-containing protein [Bradyrhizobium sp.]|nr:DNA-binding domain-containing protein [Bradyrhizobium sp.]
MLLDYPAERQRPGFAAAFAPALMDPECATPDDVVGPCGKAAVKRYNVYRNNVAVSLIEALAAIYPAVQRITGVEFFRAMARLHIHATPPTSPLLFEYGRDFPTFIEGFEHAKDMPWLADTARIERAWLDAYHAADAVPLSRDLLSIVAHDRLGGLVFAPHPATRIVRSAYPAVAIFAANRVDGPVTPIRSSAAEDALITRPDMEVTVRRLPPGGATFLTNLIDGMTLQAAAAAAFAEVPSFDLPAGIAAMVEAGVFTSIQLGD